MAANFFQPGFDEQTENQNIERQRQYAQLLRQQSEQSPQASMVSGHYVAPSITQGLAQMLKAYQGGQGMREADARQKALAEAVRGRQTEEMGQFAKLMSGAPARPTGQTYQTGANEMGDEAATVPQYQAATPGDPRAAYQFAAGAKTPGLAQAGLQGLMQMPVLEAQQAERVENRAFRQQEAEATRAQRMQELQMRMEDSRASQAERLAAQKEMREMQIQAQKDMRRMIDASRPAPERNAQIIQTENGPMQLVNGQAVPIMGPNGQPVRGTKTPNAEGDKKVSEARDVLGILDEVDKILPTATGSVAGSAVDAAAGFFGKATDGAKATAQLKTLQGALISKMPKMSGPQSDKDVQLYREMAGQVADPSLPIETRQAASKTIRMMNEKYAGVAPAAVSPQDAQAMEWARSNPNDPRSKAILQRLGGQSNGRL